MLAELLGEVLDFARFDSEKIELQESEFSLGGLLADECRQLAAGARAKGLTLDCLPVNPPVHLRTDRVKLARVLTNLVENVIKFTEVGTITVSAELLVSKSVRITVKDTGPGIPLEHQASIFDEFFQLRNPERDRSKGAGLGLAISKRLLDALGAEIRLESRPNEGSTFIVILPPSVVVPQAAVARPSGDTVRDAATPRSLAGVRILLVDDHDDTRQATSTILRSEGAIVTEAATGRSALRSFEDVPVDVVLLDLMLPDLDGVEVLEIMRQRRPAAACSVIVLTGDSARRLSDVREAGADLVVLKPFEPGELVRRIRSLAQAAG